MVSLAMTAGCVRVGGLFAVSGEMRLPALDAFGIAGAEAGTMEEPLTADPWHPLNLIFVRFRPNPFPRPLLCERTASANQIAGKWCDCSFGRQIHSVTVPAELFCPCLCLLNLILSNPINSALNSKILMRRYVPFRDRHSVDLSPFDLLPAGYRWHDAHEVFRRAVVTES
ncbi:hypothetical protein TNCV_4218861 [Trichonephila clavipes]|nr:hypothetical protein TNCV_4218861 [Trichonephila clavipes]